MTFKRLTEDAKLPVCSTEHSAGLDIFSADGYTIPSGTVCLVKTGITFEEASSDVNRWFLDLRVRSSLALDGILLANGAGVVDSDYAGNEIGVLLYNTGANERKIVKGEKVAQLIVQQHYNHMAMGVTLKYDKRDGGFGSTNDS